MDNTKKKILLKTILMGTLALLVNMGCKNRDKDSEKDDEKEEKTELVVEDTISKFDKKYKIETRADFDTLFNDAKPFIFASMISTENWRTDFHNDKGKANKIPNSVGVGLYYLGTDKNGKLDFNTYNWITTRDYVISYRNSHNGANPPDLTPDQVYNGSIAWFENMERGRHLKELFQHLQGAELTINEFAAVVSVYYNDPTIGKKLCDFIKKNCGNARKCAGEILNAKTKMNGIEQRRVHEVLVYLNYDNYCTDLFDLEIDGHLGTSIGAGKKYYNILKAKNGLTDENLSNAKDAICSYSVNNGHAIKWYISKLSNENKNAVLAFLSPVKSSVKKHKSFYEVVESKYKTKDYVGALKLYNQTLQKHKKRH